VIQERAADEPLLTGTRGSPNGEEQVVLVVRFAVQCRPEKAEEVQGVLEDVARASRALDGVVHFDVGRDLTDPNCFVATEVFEDRASLQRQEALPEVAAALEVLEDSLATAPVATIFHVSSSEPWGG
jgi:quinol monooxygenase YgiN